MLQQLAHRHRRGIRAAELGQIGGDRSVEVDPALGDFLHHQHRDNLLGHRCPAPGRAIISAAIGLREKADIAPATALRVGNLDIAAERPILNQGAKRAFIDRRRGLHRRRLHQQGCERSVHAAARLPGLIAGIAASSGGSASAA